MQAMQVSALVAVMTAGCLLLSARHTAADPAVDRELGEHLSAECVTCHQLSGRVVGGVPPIVGWPAEQFVVVMQSYRNKQRDNQAMQTIAGRLNDHEIASLAAFFGAVSTRP